MINMMQLVKNTSLRLKLTARLCFFPSVYPPCFLFGIVWATFFSANAAYSRGFSNDEIEHLVDAIGQTNQQKQKIKKIFTNPQMTKLADTVKLNITEPLKLSHRKYAHFTEPFALKLAKKFSQKWITTFRRAGRKFRVDPEVISAILLVETSYGRFKGNYKLASVFGSIVVDADDLLKEHTAEDDQNKAMIERIQRKAKWAKGELNALIDIGEKYPNIDLLTLSGSYAGAFGICQFLPSSYLKFALRAKGRGAPNLFWEPDAIYSIGNYLRGHGYKSKPGSPASREAIFAYNRSDVYVDTVLGVAKKIKAIF